MKEVANLNITEKTQKIIDLEQEIMSYTTRIPYYPLVVDEAKGCIVKDIEGNRFIDFFSSAAAINVGHNHPRVIDSIKSQLDKLIHYTPAYFYHYPHAKLAEKLCKITPCSYKKRVAFGLSGSSSIDGAIKLARSYSKKYIFISFYRSYHGTTIGATSVSGISVNMRKNMGPLMPGVYFAPYPDCYRCKYDKKFPSCKLQCFQEFKELFKTIISKDEVAAVILEVIQGDGGIIVPPNEFYEKLNEFCKKNGILIIADEIQTGFGRTGRWFATDHFSLEPDIVVVGKAIASGMPLSGIVAKKEIMESWEAPAFFFNTAGNPLCCVAALETIQIIEDENLLQNAENQGKKLIKRFEDMKLKFDCVGDVRGKGLLIGVDIVESKESKKRNRKKAAKICWRCWEKGLILTFLSDSVLRVIPPLTIKEEQLNKGADIIHESIEDVEKGKVSDKVLEEIKGW